MKFTGLKWYYVVGILCVSAALVLFFLLEFPFFVYKEEFDLKKIQINDPEIEVQYSDILEGCQYQLSAAEMIFAGTSGELSLRIICDEHMSDTSESGMMPSSYNPVIKARLEVPLADVNPSERILIPYREGQNVDLNWRIILPRTGEYTGTLWVYFVLVSKESGQSLENPILARQVMFNSRQPLGLPINWLYASGLVILILGIFFLLFGLRQRKTLQ